MPHLYPLGLGIRGSIRELLLSTLSSLFCLNVLKTIFFKTFFLSFGEFQLGKFQYVQYLEACPSMLIASRNMDFNFLISSFAQDGGQNHSINIGSFHARAEFLQLPRLSHSRIKRDAKGLIARK